MTYAVKEIFYTLQGEGINAGRPAVFCRFSGCNLWSGLEKDRATADCNFCDTDFVGTDGDGGGKFETAAALADAVTEHWPEGASDPFIVCTGGEPMLQIDEALINALHAKEFEIAVETNGTINPPDGLDWICMSPKAGTSLALTSGHELKLIYPQPGADPTDFEDLEFQHFLLQPMDGPDRERNTGLALEYCLAHPPWRLSLQTHKSLGIR
jgi:7-carboxy-7-deazaguanine synthase